MVKYTVVNICYIVIYFILIALGSPACEPCPTFVGCPIAYILVGDLRS